jgi:hypothetical protein
MSYAFSMDYKTAEFINMDQKRTLIYHNKMNPLCVTICD